MSSNNKKILAGILIVIAIIIFGYTLVQAIYYVPNSGTMPPSFANSTSTSSIASSTVSIGPVEDPTRLIIPSLSIDANVQYVGVTKAGNLGVPNNFTDVAWYKYGTVPGQIGSAVIDGHVDNAISLPGVFKNLDTIKVGDDVYVQTASSTKLHFVVSDVEEYDSNSLPLQQIFLPKDSARLNLITCTGTWVESVKSYDRRLVVYTKLVNS